jgi:enoyl-CoA hydratase/carnithine racemase
MNHERISGPVDATIFQSLQDLLTRMDTSPSLRVVVFEGANPEFYLAHFDLTGKLGNIMTAVGVRASRS